MEFNSIDSYFGLSNDKIAQERKNILLLAVRFKVTLLYPNCEFKRGDIIKPASNIKTEIYRSHPKLFRELKWWEDRDILDMPKYIKSDKYSIMAVLIDVNGNNAILEDNTGSKANFPFDTLMPATEWEYQQYINKNKGR